MLSQVNNITNSQSIEFAIQSDPASSPMLPKEINKDKWQYDYAYYCYIGGVGDWETRGCPQVDMHEYTTECRDITKVFSYKKGEHEVANWIMFGELADGSVFHFEGGCDFTGFDCQGGGVMHLAPTWENLFDHLQDENLYEFIQNMDDENAPKLMNFLGNKSADAEALRSSLKDIFSLLKK